MAASKLRWRTGRREVLRVSRDILQIDKKIRQPRREAVLPCRCCAVSAWPAVPGKGASIRRKEQRLNLVHHLKRTSSRVVSRVTDAVLPQTLTARLRDERGWRAWVDGLSAEVLDDLTLAPPDVKRELFRRNVTLVEIETHAMCNRLCSFCPNVDGNRLKNAKQTDVAMLNRVFDELGSIDYRRQIKVARYSEPLRNPEYLYACIASARAHGEFPLSAIHYQIK